MTPQKKNALMVISAGLAFAIVAFALNAVVAPSGGRLAQMFSLAIVFGNAIFVYGCILLARAKGRPWYFGLLGLLSCLGLAILWFAVGDASTKSA